MVSETFRAKAFETFVILDLFSGSEGSLSSIARSGPAQILFLPVQQRSYFDDVTLLSNTPGLSI